MPKQPTLGLGCGMHAFRRTESIECDNTYHWFTYKWWCYVPRMLSIYKKIFHHEISLVHLVNSSHKFAHQNFLHRTYVLTACVYKCTMKCDIIVLVNIKVILSCMQHAQSLHDSNNWQWTIELSVITAIFTRTMFTVKNVAIILKCYKKNKRLHT